jgi:hypothetical protein
MWIQIELPTAVTITETQIEGLAPRRYSVQVSPDGTSWGAPVAEGEGQTPLTVIPFEPVRAKFIRITQTGSAEKGELWIIRRLRLYTRES